MDGLSNPIRNEQPVSDIALVNCVSRRVCDLAGFRKKTHQVPTETTDYTRAFVARIAEEDLISDLDFQFAEFRRHFKFKRSQMEVRDPGDGMAVIVTPQFEYRVSVTLSEEDSSVCFFKQEVTRISGPEVLLSEVFSEAFVEVFNSIEVTPPSTIDVEEFIDSIEEMDKHTLKIDFDRNSTFCRLSILRVPGELLVESNRISLQLDQTFPPTRLIDAFFQFREELKDIEF